MAHLASDTYQIHIWERETSVFPEGRNAALIFTTFIIFSLVSSFIPSFFPPVILTITSAVQWAARCIFLPPVSLTQLEQTHAGSTLGLVFRPGYVEGLPCLGSSGTPWEGTRKKRDAACKCYTHSTRRTEQRQGTLLGTILEMTEIKCFLVWRCANLAQASGCKLADICSLVWMGFIWIYFTYIKKAVSADLVDIHCTFLLSWASHFSCLRTQHFW